MLNFGIASWLGKFAEAEADVAGGRVVFEKGQGDIGGGLEEGIVNSVDGSKGLCEGEGDVDRGLEVAAKGLS